MMMLMKKAILAAALFATFAVANVSASDSTVLSYGPEDDSTGAGDFGQEGDVRRVLKSNKNKKKAKSIKDYYYYGPPGPPGPKPGPKKSAKKSKKAKKTRRPKPNPPTLAPTASPTQAPTASPTQAPTDSPTEAPTNSPTEAPTNSPTQAPTDSPTQAPTNSPTATPTDAPTTSPTNAPTSPPTGARSIVPAFGLTGPLLAFPGGRERELQERELQAPPSTPEEYQAILVGIATEEADNDACTITVEISERLEPSSAECVIRFTAEQIALADACYKFFVTTFDSGGCPVDEVGEELHVGFETNKYEVELGGPTFALPFIPSDETRAPTTLPTVVPLPKLPALVLELGLQDLATAVARTGLTEALSEGIFTVFGPDDSAFDALPDGVLRCLFSTEPGKVVLQQILFYHVTSGVVLSSDLENGQQIPTLLENGTLTVNLEGIGGNETSVVEIVGQVNEATVISADNMASNGVIHIIDQVLLPPGIGDMLSEACNTDQPSAAPTSSASPSGSGSSTRFGE